MGNILYLRRRLTEAGIRFLGSPSAIVPVIIGEEGLARITARLLIEKGVIINVIEFPAVPKREARIRIQVMANHTKEDIDLLVEGLIESIEQAKFIRSQVL